MPLIFDAALAVDGVVRTAEGGPTAGLSLHPLRPLVPPISERPRGQPLEGLLLPIGQIEAEEAGEPFTSPPVAEAAVSAAILWPERGEERALLLPSPLLLRPSPHTDPETSSEPLPLPPGGQSERVLLRAEGRGDGPSSGILTASLCSSQSVSACIALCQRGMACERSK